MTPELESRLAQEAQENCYTGEHLHALRRGAEIALSEVEALRSSLAVAENIAENAKSVAQAISAECLELVAENAELRRQQARIKVDALNDFHGHIMDMAEETPCGAEDRQRGSSVYNWYRHFTLLISGYTTKIEEQCDEN